MSLDPRDQRIAELEGRVAERDATIAALVAENERLRARVDELTQLVLKLEAQLKRHSGNSDKPPSSDSPGQRAERREQRKGDEKKSPRKRGGQPGHTGSSRTLVPPERVDEIKNLFPSECENCWAALPQTAGLLAQRTQTFELPQPRVHVVEWVRHCVTCPQCSHGTWASGAAIPVSPFGPRLTALVGLVTGVYHLSRRTAVSLLSDVIGIDISLGAVSVIESRVSEAVKAPVEEAWAKVEAAEVKHTDGTTWFQAGVMKSLWTIATSVATVFKILVNGKADTLAPLFGEKKVGVLVSDRGKALNFWVMAMRQICWAHLLRKAISFAERGGPAGALGQELLDYIAIIFDYWGQLKAGTLSREAFRTAMAPVRPQVEALLKKGAAAAWAYVSGSCEDIIAHSAALWTFVDKEGVEPTNNHAERELRAFVLWRKRSFGTQSERGNLFAERVMTVAHTARKQDKNVLEFLTACCMAARNGVAPPSLFAAA